MPTGIYKRTDKMRKNISIATSIGVKNKWKDPVYRKKQRRAHIGIKFTSERCKNISKSLLGKKGHTPWNKGLTKETDERIAKAAIMGSKSQRLRFKHEDPWCKGKKGIFSKIALKRIKRGARIGMIKYIKEHGVKYPNFNFDTIPIFKTLNSKFNLNGVFAKNPNEFLIKDLGYFVDYYEPSLNLVIEWNEKKHYDKNHKLSKKHKKRQREIKRFLKCKFVNVNERKFNQERFFKRIEKIISNVKNQRKAS